MYNNQVTIANIEKTTAYKNSPDFLKRNIVKKENRLLIEKGFVHFLSTNEILDSIGNRNQLILKELLNTL
jgi:hypothetical protein